MQRVVEDTSKVLSPRSGPVSQSLLRQTVKAAGLEADVDDACWQDQMWARLRAAPPWHSRGDRIPRCRFFVHIYSSSRGDGRGRCKLCGLLLTCCALDLGSKDALGNFAKRESKINGASPLTFAEETTARENNEARGDSACEW